MILLVNELTDDTKYKEWVKVVMQDNPKRITRFQELRKNHSVAASLMIIREEIFSRRDNGLMKNENMDLQSFLQETFLEVVDIKEVRKLMLKNGWTLEAIIKKHNTYPTRRLLSILVCGNR